MSEMKFALYDTQDDCWMGDNDAGTGPRTFDNELLARVAAQVLDVQLGQRSGRTRAVEFTERPLRIRDEVDTKMSPLGALKGLESGRFI